MAGATSSLQWSTPRELTVAVALLLLGEPLVDRVVTGRAVSSKPPQCSSVALMRLPLVGTSVATAEGAYSLSKSVVK